MAHKIMASWLAGRRSYYPEALVIPRDGGCGLDGGLVGCR